MSKESQLSKDPRLRNRLNLDVGLEMKDDLRVIPMNIDPEDRLQEIVEIHWNMLPEEERRRMIGQRREFHLKAYLQWKGLDVSDQFFDKLRKCEKKLKSLENKIRRSFRQGMKLAREATETRDQGKRHESRVLIHIETHRHVKEYKNRLVKYRRKLQDSSWQTVEALEVKEIKHRIIFQRHNFLQDFF